MKAANWKPAVTYWRERAEKAEAEREASLTYTSPYKPGDVVEYADNQDRLITGKILSISCRWIVGSCVEVYTISHPTYRSKNLATTREKIKCLSN